MSDSIRILNPGSPYPLGTDLYPSSSVQLWHSINWSAVIALIANLAAWALLVAVLFAVFN